MSPLFNDHHVYVQPLVLSSLDVFLQTHHVIFLVQSDDEYKDILLALERTTNSSREIQEWWIVDQPATSLIAVGGANVLSDRREAGLQILVFSDKVSPPSLGFLAGYG